MTGRLSVAAWLGAGLLLSCGCNAEEGGLLAALQQAASADAAAKPDAAAPPKRAANRLARESSPYLLQHAHNPVDWHPWGPEALEKAKADGKPIFLSVGYSSCHWCHVMERLVFENEEIAAYMNEHFVNIKVDREERPDIDDVYMTALQVYFQRVGSNQGGGWPLSMFLTPEGKPIAGGTYFPPEDGHGRMGFPTVMRIVEKQWTDRREDVEKQAEILAQDTRRVMKPRLVLEKVEIGRPLAAAAGEALLASYDSEFGGLDFNEREPDGPKFPVPAKLALLQYEVRRHGNEAAAKAVYHTLDAMAAGGIHDHLGGGFHRYSTDRRWHVPHFEKMLYDQAQLLEAYVEAFRQTNNRAYRETAEGVVEFVFRELTDRQGGFYSALDADTDGVEGRFYVWSRAEVEDVLGAEDAALFAQAYGLTGESEFEHGDVLHLARPVEELAQERGTPASELKRRLAEMRDKLLEVRGRRQPVGLDDKILTSWNGLMIRGLARAGEILGRAEYTAAAEKAALFVLTNMRDEQGHLHRTHRAGKSSLNAYLDDYAFLVSGLLALHETTGEQKWLNAARRLTDDQIRLFQDAEGKGFYFTSHGHEELLARTKNSWDGVLPSGNAVAARNLLRLAELTGEKPYAQHAAETLDLFAPMLKVSPAGMATTALALGEFLDRADAGGGAAEPPAAPKPAAEKDRELPSEDREGAILQVAGEATPKDQEETDEYVAARSFLSADRLPAGGKARIVMFLKVKEGWHVNANPPEPDYVIPTTFTLKSKFGIKLTDVRYPDSKELRIEGFDEAVRVYEGRVAIYGTLQIPETAGGTDEIVLDVEYQVCNDKTCLRPTTITLKGKVPIAPRGAAVNQINEKLFPTETRRR